jgi:hypothetical protein
VNRAKAVTSLASIRWGRKSLYVAPFRSLVYGAVSLIVVFLVLVFIDRLVLGSLERAGWTAGELWARCNKAIEENHRRKTTTNECELRHWKGQPLDVDGTRSGPATKRRILVMGDSFIWGPPYFTLNHLWWRQLAIELERRGYRDVQVVAAGHPGWSTRRQLECAKELIPEVKPDLIIWGYVTNDPDEKLVPQIFDSQDRPPYGQRIRRQFRRFLPNLAFKFESLRAEKLAEKYTGPKYGYAYPDWELQLLGGENFIRYQETIRELGAYMQQAGIATFMQTLPHVPSREYFEPRYEPVLKEWKKAGIAVNDTLDKFVETYGNVPPIGAEALSWGIDPADSHPGPRATHFFAVQAANHIEEHWPELLGPKDTSRPHELAINDWLPYDLNVRKLDPYAFELDYPAKTDLMLKLPGEEPSALVALRFPVRVDEILLEGNGLVGGRLWVSTIDPDEHCDENRWHEVASFRIDSIVCQLPPDLAARELAEIRFTAVIRGPDRRLRLTLVRHAASEERP